MRLLDDLWPVVTANNYDGVFGGPLTTTFLISLAMPILVLPFERILVQGGEDPFPAYADDTGLDAAVTKRLTRGLGGRFEGMPFFHAGHWSVVETNDEYFRLPEGLPGHLADALGADAAYRTAARMPAQSLLACLRNALSHGGISYLDANGHTTIASHEQVSMLAFVSVRIKGQGADRQALGLRVARISEEHFRLFLGSWVTWLAG